MAELGKSWSHTSLFFVLFTVFLTIKITECKFSSFDEFKTVVCGLDNKNVHANNLTKPLFWSLNYTEDTTRCITTDSSDASKVTGCKFKFSFCHAFNCSTTDTSLMNTTACFETSIKNDTNKLKLGTYNASVNPFDDKNANDKFWVHFINGSKFITKSNQSCSLSMDMEFNCNRHTVWKDPAGEKEAFIDPAFLTAITYDSDKCAYSLHFNYTGACAPPAPAPSSSNGLSAGSVMIIMFFVSLTLYFVLGSLIKFISGNRGVEVIPNNEFWVVLPVYIADGFLFTFSCGMLDGRTTASKYDTI